MIFTLLVFFCTATDLQLEGGQCKRIARSIIIRGQERLGDNVRKGSKCQAPWRLPQFGTSPSIALDHHFNLDRVFGSMRSTPYRYYRRLQEKETSLCFR